MKKGSKMSADSCKRISDSLKRYCDGLSAESKKAIRIRLLDGQKNLRPEDWEKRNKKISEALTGRPTGPILKGYVHTSPTHKKGSSSHCRARGGILRDDAGRVWPFRNLTQFVREHGELFPVETLNWKPSGKFGSTWNCAAVRGLSGLFSTSGRNCSWHGWTVVSSEEVQQSGRDLLTRQKG